MINITTLYPTFGEVKVNQNQRYPRKKTAPVISQHLAIRNKWGHTRTGIGKNEQVESASATTSQRYVWNSLRTNLESLEHLVLHITWLMVVWAKIHFYPYCFLLSSRRHMYFSVFARLMMEETINIRFIHPLFHGVCTQLVTVEVCHFQIFVEQQYRHCLRWSQLFQAILRWKYRKWLPPSLEIIIESACRAFATSSKGLFPFQPYNLCFYHGQHSAFSRPYHVLCDF